MPESLPPNFDWVTARAKCSPYEMYETLLGAAKENVNARNKSLGYADDRLGDRFLPCGVIVHTRSFSVFGPANGDRRSVEFAYTSDSILIEPMLGEKVKVTLSLNDNAVCGLKIGVQILDPWQVLRRFLEPVLFGA